EDGQLMTIGSDGVVRVWDFERINTADSNSDGIRFEMEPNNELVVGRNVCLSSVVRRSSPPHSFVWFAQDSNGAIWKLDLSFTNTSPDPECLFSFHGGMIQGLDVSKKSHLMATTTLDCSVKVFDFLAKRELTTRRFNQGGTALCWAPAKVSQSGGLLVTGFENGVVRLLELYNPQRLQTITGQSPEGDAELRLRQPFKPHDAAVTAVAYERNGEILATGSADCTVFFFTVGENYNPIGFIHVPGLVKALEWSPHSHVSSVFNHCCCECEGPDLREEDFARNKAIKEEKKKKAKEERLKDTKKLDVEQEEEKEEKEELPPIYIPDPPSPLCCGFYSQPGHFWLSMVCIQTQTHTPIICLLEMAKQKLQNDQLQKEAELKVSEKQKNLSELQKKFKKVLNDNQNLSEHIRLKPEVQMQICDVYVCTIPELGNSAALPLKLRFNEM
uniref:WD repeat domain 52 n=1 Tax=Pundamilia nyererei TaxID=303518 RepID=A0A3B4GGR1_9CICH